MAVDELDDLLAEALPESPVAVQLFDELDALLEPSEPEPPKKPKKAEKPPKPKGRPTNIEECIRYLAGTCDGARTLDGHGFNRNDAEVGHSIASRPFDRWSDRQRAWAFKKLRFYRRQFEAAGLDWESVPAPPPAPPRPGPITEIITVPNGFGVRFAHLPNEQFQAVRAAVQRIPGVHWVYDKERLMPAVFPFDSASARGLRELVKEQGFHIEPEVGEKFFELIDRAALLKEWSRSVEAPEYELGLGDFETLDGKRPWGHQVSGVRYLEAVSWKAMIADQPGSGKTGTAFLAMEKADAYPVLWVGPKTTLPQIEANARRWLPHRTVQILQGGAMQFMNADILLVNPEAFRMDKNGELNDLAFGLTMKQLKGFIWDESHKGKNRKSQRVLIIKQILEAQKACEFRLCMSGTPILNNIREFIAQLEMLGTFEKAFGSIADFVRMPPKLLNQKLMEVGYLCRLKEHHVFTPGETLLPWYHADRWVQDQITAGDEGRKEWPEVEKELRVFGYELLRGALKLPPKLINPVPTPMSDPKAYRWKHEHAVDYLRQLAEESGGGYERFTQWMKAQVLITINKLRVEVVHQKWEAARDWIEEFLLTGEKLVVCTWHQDTAERLEKHFPGCVAITGKVKPELREEARLRFAHDPDVKLMILQIAAGGVGIDELQTRCSNIAFLELGWNPGTHEQAEDRLHRGGQTQTVNAHYLLAEKVDVDTIDQYMVQIIDSKRGITEAGTHGGEVAQERMIGELVNRLIAA